MSLLLQGANSFSRLVSDPMEIRVLLVNWFRQHIDPLGVRHGAKGVQLIRLDYENIAFTNRHLRMFTGEQVIDHDFYLAGDNKEKFTRFLVIVIPSYLLSYGLDKIDLGPTFLRNSPELATFIHICHIRQEFLH